LALVGCPPEIEGAAHVFELANIAKTTIEVGELVLDHSQLPVSCVSRSIRSPKVTAEAAPIEGGRLSSPTHIVSPQ
jgi:hypothetical protein